MNFSDYLPILEHKFLDYSFFLKFLILPFIGDKFIFLDLNLNA